MSFLKWHINIFYVFLTAYLCMQPIYCFLLNKNYQLIYILLIINSLSTTIVAFTIFLVNTQY